MDNVPSSSTSSQGEDFVTQGQTVLILCGLIASGKSTFAEALQRHFPQFRRCNQDDLGDRRRVENLARATLAEGQSACVDRTNFNAVQRSYWIDIGHEFPGTNIWIIVFDTPYDVCAARLRTRENHPTITNAEVGLTILSRFAADFQQPSPHEGYHKILYVKPEDTTEVYSRSDIAAILQRVRDAPLIHSSEMGPPAYLDTRIHRGRASRGHRGYRRRFIYPRGRGADGVGSSHTPLVRPDVSRGGSGKAWGSKGG